MVDRLGEQPVRVDHERDVDALTEIFTSSKSTSSEVGELVLGRRHERLGRDAAVLLVQMSGSSDAAVDADADRHAAVLRLARDELDVLGLADVAGVESQRLHAGFERGQRELVLEVDVGDDRHRRAGHDLRETFGRLLLVAGAAHDVAPGRGQRVDLGQRAVDVGGLGRRHRLDRDRRVTTDGDARPRRAADEDLAGGATVELRRPA